MRFWSALFCLFTLVCGPGARAQMDLVFDLDWTLFYTTSVASVQENPQRTYEYEGVYYRMSDEAPEVLLRLQQQGYRLSLFSGGRRARNEFLAGQLVRESAALPGGPLRFYRVLSFEDLSRRERPASSRFTDTYYKDLTKVQPRLDEVILVDDMNRFSAPGQERNLFWLTPVYNDHWRYPQPGTVAGLFDPRTREDWRRERRKLVDLFQGLQELQERQGRGEGKLVDLLAEEMGARHPSCGGLFR